MHRLLAAVAFPLLLTACSSTAIQFPVQPELFIDAFSDAEGITFSAAGDLFIGADRAVWLAAPDGSYRKIADVDAHLGQAPIGERDILAADWGPRNFLREGKNDDGVIWRITPEGTKTEVARGIGDPNAILMLADGSFLVTDDFTDEIYRVENGQVSVWTTAVPFANGMALSRDERTLYVAQIFRTTEPRPIVFDDAMWAIPLDGTTPGPASIAVRTGQSGAVDGLAADEKGRIYIAENVAGKIWRFDPATKELTLIAQDMKGVASLAFGQGKFDRRALYVTRTGRGGGKVWKVRVGVRGATLHLGQ